MPFQFDSILAVDNFFNCLKSVLILAAFFKLRVSKPDAMRTYKVPVNSRFMEILFLIPPFLTGCLVVGLTFFESIVSISFCSGGLIFGVLFFCYLKRNGWINYETVSGAHSTLETDQGEEKLNLERNHIRENLIQK